MLKKFFKTVLAGIAIMFMVVSCCFAANLKPTDEFFVNDFAGVLNNETRDYVCEIGKDLCQKTTAQLVVAVVSSLEGDTIENFSLKLFRDWGLGSKEKNNGVMILLAPNERKVRVEVGYGLEGAINDSKAGRFIQNYANPHFKNDDWDGGIKELYTVLAQEIYKEYEADVPQSVKDIHKNDEEFEDIASIITFAVILGIGVVVFFAMRKRKFVPFYGQDDDDNHHGGFFSSGGSGGFGGFSGGGGSCGGGGASSSF